MQSNLTEGWILAGVLDGAPAHPPLDAALGGLSYVARLICDLASAGATTVHIVWCGDSAPPELAASLSDPRIAERARVDVVRAPPAGSPDDGVLVVRADRVFHREVPKLAAAAYRRTGRPAKVEGADYDAVIAVDRVTARALCAAALVPGGFADEVTRLAPETAPPPFAGFCMAAPDRAGIRRAGRALVWSLRKSADGIAARLLNRRISLPLTRLLASTRVMPNQVTVFALLCAILGGIVISRGGYAAGALGMFFVELGSILDGIDGELARLRYQHSRTGQWMDTVADDLANLAYASGVAVNLHLAGVSWALPIGMAACGAFIATQATQYWLIVRVYKSGDLAAIPWAFQSTNFLSQRPRGVIPWIKATVPKMLKRDFAVTAFLVLALCGQLAPILVVFSGGAFTFFIVLFTQLFRNRATLGTPARV